jgi:hypothetical protein
VFGTPVETTLSELSLEAFYPADEATVATMQAMNRRSKWTYGRISVHESLDVRSDAQVAKGTVKIGGQIASGFGISTQPNLNRSGFFPACVLA